MRMLFLSLCFLYYRLRNANMSRGSPCAQKDVCNRLIIIGVLELLVPFLPMYDPLMYEGGSEDTSKSFITRIDTVVHRTATNGNRHLDGEDAVHQQQLVGGASAFNHPEPTNHNQVTPNLIRNTY